MLQKLQNIAQIQSGIYQKPELEGELIYFQTKHFNDNGELIVPNILPDLPLNEKTKKQILKQNDILFSAKGSRNFAFLFKQNIGHAVASTTFFIIKLKSDAKQFITPEYLTWFLNHETTTQYLKSQSKGTDVKALSIKTIKELTINIPPLEVQKKILKFDELVNLEKQLFEKLQSYKQLLNSTIMYNWTKESE